MVGTTDLVETRSPGTVRARFGERPFGPVARALRRPALRWLVVAVAVGVSAWSIVRVPHASWPPALAGLVPWVVGKYVLCPLRWHALSTGGRRRGWYVRTYAEGELLGLASPGHVGADLWRIHRLHAQAGMVRACAVAEVALDRLIGALGLTAFVLFAGASLPPRLLLAAVGIALVVGLAALLVGRRRPDLLAARPLPPVRVVVVGLLLSLGYQASIVCLLMGAVTAMGSHAAPIALLGVFGASQVAGIVPGVNGASPRDGALVIGLAALGVSWQAAVGAVAMTAMLAWLPALLLGGGSLTVRRLTRRRVAAQPA